MNNPVCYIVLSGIIILCLFIYLQQTEHFATSVEIHPDIRFGDLLRDQLNSNEDLNSNNKNKTAHTHDLSKYVYKTEIEPPKPPVDMSRFIRRTDVERTAKEIAETYCGFSGPRAC